MSLSFKQMPTILALVLISLNAHAQSFEVELRRVAQLRQAFGDALVSALTNLPPAEYAAARQKALVMATQVASGGLAREEARSTLCAAFTKGAGGCPEVSIALSGIDKSASVEPQAPVAEAPVGASFSEAALTEGALESVESEGMSPLPSKKGSQGETELDSLELPDSAAIEPPVANPRRANAEPELEAEESSEISAPGRQVSSETDN